MSKCETCQEQATVHFDIIGAHFCRSCLDKIDKRCAEMGTRPLEWWEENRPPTYAQTDKAEIERWVKEQQIKLGNHVRLKSDPERLYLVTMTSPFGFTVGGVIVLWDKVGEYEVMG